jgi:hypothetical protein
MILPGPKPMWTRLLIWAIILVAAIGVVVIVFRKEENW